QISKEEISSATISPGGELGLLKKWIDYGAATPAPAIPSLATLLDYLPGETIFVFCEPEILAERAGQYSQQLPAGDPFLVEWKTLQDQLAAKEVSMLEFREAHLNPLPSDGAVDQGQAEAPVPAQGLGSSADAFEFSSLDAFRPLGPQA